MTKKRFAFIFYYFHLRITKHQGTFLSVLLVGCFYPLLWLVPRRKMWSFYKWLCQFYLEIQSFKLTPNEENSKFYWTSPSNVYLQGNFLTQRKESKHTELFSKAQNEFPCFGCHLCNDNSFKIDIWTFPFCFFLNRFLEEIVFQSVR
jgi:hypothetical protein